MQKERIYVFLDLSLTNQQKLVQTGHLSYESSRAFPVDKHPSIILLAMEPHDLEKVQTQLDKINIKNVSFFEPDLNKNTGLATEPLTKEQAKKLSEFRLIKKYDFQKECV
jgi:hypothetical protein